MDGLLGFLSWPGVVKAVAKQGVVCFVSYGRFCSVSLLCYGRMYCFVTLFPVVSTTAIDCSFLK